MARSDADRDGTIPAGERSESRSWDEGVPRRGGDAAHLAHLIGPWTVLVVERDSAAEQMAFDVELAAAAQPVFRLFRWAHPAVSVGRNQLVPDWADPWRVSRYGVEFVQRPTGGALAVHGSDLSCSVIVPRHPAVKLPRLMETVCGAVAGAVSASGVSARWLGDASAARRGGLRYCLTETSPYAVLAPPSAGSPTGDRKLCGFAVRRFPQSWLIQGSLLVRTLPSVFQDVMPAGVHAQFAARAVSLEAAAGRPVTDEELVARMIQAWAEAWRRDAVHAL